MATKLVCDRCNGIDGVKPIQVTLKADKEQTIAAIVTEADLCERCYPVAVERIKAALAPPKKRVRNG